MNAVKSIRELLEQTQPELAEGIGVSQASVSAYEAGARVKPEVALRLIDHASKHGLRLTLDHVYAIKPLPQFKRRRPANDAPQQAKAA